MAFLIVLSWSAAYTYGWGQAYYYGFPWWYVDVGVDNVARSLSYVLYVTLWLFAAYLIGLLLLTKVKPFLSLSCVKFLRALIIVAVLWLYLLIGSVLLTGKITPQIGVGYVVVVICSTVIFQSPINQHIQSLHLANMLRLMYHYKNYVLLSTYLYFVIFAFLTGYFRPYFKTGFDQLEIAHKMYYVLAKYNKTFVLAEEVKRDNEHFYLYEISPNHLNHIQVVTLNRKIIE